MGSGSSKEKVKRRASEPNLKQISVNKVPVRRTVSALSQGNVNLIEDSKKTFRNFEDPEFDIPEEGFEDGRLGIKVSFHKQKRILYQKPFLTTGNDHCIRCHQVTKLY